MIVLFVWDSFGGGKGAHSQDEQAENGKAFSFFLTIFLFLFFTFYLNKTEKKNSFLFSCPLLPFQTTVLSMHIFLPSTQRTVCPH